MENYSIDKTKLINAINCVTNVQVSFKEDLELKNWLILKEALSSINNIITFELTQRFISNLDSIFHGVSKEEIKIMLDKNSKVHVNKPGYDFINESIKVVAEVKGNIPCRHKRKCKCKGECTCKYEKYGSNQLKGIDEDINNMLTSGKGDVSDFYKFMVLLEYETEKYSTTAAIKNYLDNKFPNKLELFNDNITEKDLRTDVVYIISLDI